MEFKYECPICHSRKTIKKPVDQSQDEFMKKIPPDLPCNRCENSKCLVVGIDAREYVFEQYKKEVDNDRTAASSRGSTESSE